jgi:hypothetical protein
MKQTSIQNAIKRIKNNCKDMGKKISKEELAKTLWIGGFTKKEIKKELGIELK